MDYSLDEPDDNLGALSPFIIDVDVDTTTAIVRAEYRLKTEEKALRDLFEKSCYATNGNFSSDVQEVHSVISEKFENIFALTLYAVNPKNICDRQIKTKKEVDIKNNKIKLELTGYSKTKEVQTNIDIKNKKEVEKLNQHFNKELEKEIINTFNNIKENYNTDIFGFRQLYYHTDYKYFKEKCNNWYEDIYPNIKLEVKSNIKLYEKGNTLGGIEYERKNK